MNTFTGIQRALRAMGTAALVASATAGGLHAFTATGMVQDGSGGGYGRVQVYVFPANLYSTFFSTNAQDQATNIWRNTWSLDYDPVGQVVFDQLTNGNYYWYAVPTNGMKLQTNLGVLLGTSGADLTFTVPVSLTNLPNLPDAAFVTPFFADRNDVFAMQILKSNAAPERIVVTLLTINGSMRYKIFDQVVSARSYQALLPASKLRSDLKIGTYVVETKLIPTGAGEYDFTNPVRRRFLVWVE